MLALSAVHGQDRQPGQGVNWFSRDKEIALGQQLALEIRKKTTPLDNLVVGDYVKRVGANLAAQMAGGWTYQFELIQDDLGGATYEPAALPGGIIFVSQYTIAAAQNEAEFAGMLAHAMAHVAARHKTRELTRGELMQIGTLAAANANPNSPTPTAAPIGMLAFQRANEREADHLAVQAMAAAGYDPAGLASYVQRLQPAPDRGRVFETLPDRDQRVAAINAEIGKLPQRTYSSSEDFARIQAQVVLPRAAPALIK
jgi:predicted Zn-dependent protease